MIQCKDCELCEIGPDGQKTFKCDPFSNIKEPECIAKWQLIRLDMLVASYQGMLKWYGKLAPIQDKFFKLSFENSTTKINNLNTTIENPPTRRGERQNPKFQARSTKLTRLRQARIQITKFQN